MKRVLAKRIDEALKARGAGSALVAGRTLLSGNDLRDRAHMVAATLRSQNVSAGSTIGIETDRSAEALIIILGILFSDCAYLPMDSDIPVTWQQVLLTAGGARLVVSSQETIGSYLNIVSRDEILSGSPFRGGASTASHAGAHLSEGGPSALAYIMGTSGSTGVPKAVPVRDDSLLEYCDAFAQRVGGHSALSGLRMASVTTLSADLGNTMVFPSLLFGGELHLVPRDAIQDPQRLGEYIQNHEVDALKIVPTHLRALLDVGGDVFPKKLLVVGGEPFGLDLLRRLEERAPGCAVFNHYGPTETTIGAAMYRVGTSVGTADELEASGCQSVPVGTALGETALSVVNDRRDAVDFGVVGELAIQGNCVSEGYLGSDDAARVNFAEGNGSKRGPVYYTGDLARICASGNIELK
ncbi:MAG: AMP-binding protein, partial [Hyphomonadaceae bacterium]|nr:AMP-binding protein [Hyphomonadaceae bacterium]